MPGQALAPELHFRARDAEQPFYVRLNHLVVPGQHRADSKVFQITLAGERGYFLQQSCLCPVLVDGQQALG